MKTNQTTSNILTALAIMAIICITLYKLKNEGVIGNTNAYDNLRPEYKHLESSKHNEQVIHQESNRPKERRVKCLNCKGVGVVTCRMCNATGVNNMGATCGCVTYVENCHRLGRAPTRTALRWTCETCNGTGMLVLKN